MQKKSFDYNDIMSPLHPTLSCIVLSHQGLAKEVKELGLFTRTQGMLMLYKIVHVKQCIVYLCTRKSIFWICPSPFCINNVGGITFFWLYS
jgi:hypothetical protein